MMYWQCQLPANSCPNTCNPVLTAIKIISYPYSLLNCCKKVISKIGGHFSSIILNKQTFSFLAKSLFSTENASLISSTRAMAYPPVELLTKWTQARLQSNMCSQWIRRLPTCFSMLKMPYRSCLKTFSSAFIIWKTTITIRY